MKNRKCIAKAKTASARRTLDPLYQQQLTFREDYRQCILQVSSSCSGSSTTTTSSVVVQLEID